MHTAKRLKEYFFFPGELTFHSKHIILFEKREFFLLSIPLIQKKKLLLTLRTHNPHSHFSLVRTYLPHTSPPFYFPLLCHHRLVPPAPRRLLSPFIFFCPYSSYGEKQRGTREIKEKDSSIIKKERQTCNNNQLVKYTHQGKKIYALLKSPAVHKRSIFKKKNINICIF